MIEYDIINYENIFDYARYLCECIKESNFKPDIILGISRGGLILTRIIADMLGVEDIKIIGAKSYFSIGKKEEDVVLYNLDDVKLTSQKVLIVDDVADSGKTLEVIANYVEKDLNVGCGNYKVATLHYKPNTSVYEPDFYVVETKQWVVYPWEWYGFAREYMDDSKTTRTRKRIDLLDIGIPLTVIDDVLNKEE
jgi:hypoxanthine phosphoribosyltransferase